MFRNRSIKAFIQNELLLFIGILILHFPVLSLLVNFNQIPGSTQVNWQTWCQWDCKIYVTLFPQYHAGAFFPAWPALLTAFSSLLGTLGLNSSKEFQIILVSIFVSILSNRFALALFHRFSERTTRNFLNFSYFSWIALVILNFFPASFFWSAGYSESLFFGLWVIGMCLHRKNLVLANWMIGLTAIVRPQGVWIAAAWGIVGMLEKLKRIQKENERVSAKIFLDWIPLGIPFLLFVYWSYSTTHDPLYFLTAQGQWGHKFSIDRWLHAHLPRLNLDFLILIFAWYTLFRWRNRSYEYQFLAIAAVLSCEIPLFLTGFISWTRYQSTSIGLIISFTEVCVQSPWVLVGALCYFVPNLAIKIAAWSQGAWEG